MADFTAMAQPCRICGTLPSLGKGSGSDGWAYAHRCSVSVHIIEHGSHGTYNEAVTAWNQHQQEKPAKMATRINPHHWIWQTPLAKRFEADEDAYQALRSLIPALTLSQIEDLIGEGMRAEQIVTLCRMDACMPESVVRIIGAGLAYWVQRAQEDRPC